MTPINVNKRNRIGNPYFNQNAGSFLMIVDRSQKAKTSRPSSAETADPFRHLPRSGRSGRKSTVRKPSPAMTAPTVKALASPAR
jgi:pimeloyl-ACP methyl ester carboxylesterase